MRKCFPKNRNSNYEIRLLFITQKPKTNTLDALTSEQSRTVFNSLYRFVDSAQNIKGSKDAYNFVYRTIYDPSS